MKTTLKEKAKYLLFFLFFTGISDNLFSQTSPDFLFYQKKNFLTELSFSSSGFSIRDSLIRQKKYYAYTIAIYSRTGFFLKKKLNAGIAFDYSWNRSNILPELSALYSIGLYSRYYFYANNKIGFFSELNSGATNACYTEPIPIPGISGVPGLFDVESGIIIKENPIPYFKPAIGFNIGLLKNFYLVLTLSQNYVIMHKECNRAPLGFSLGGAWFFNPCKKIKDND